MILATGPMALAGMLMVKLKGRVEHLKGTCETASTAIRIAKVPEAPFESGGVEAATGTLISKGPQAKVIRHSWWEWSQTFGSSGVKGWVLENRETA